MAAHLKYKSGSSWIDYNLVVYPVGAIYISYTSTSPASLFGGTWTPITGRFLYMNSGTSTGGSNTVSIATNNLPYRLLLCTQGISGAVSCIQASWGIKTVQNNAWTMTSLWDSGLYDYGSDGQIKPMNNMPAYQTVYAWRRTA